MYSVIILLSSVIFSKCFAETVYETDVNFRVEAGSRTCIFESGKAGEMMEVYYQVLDGQHGDLDISLDIIDPNAEKIVTDYKKSQNSIIIELTVSGDYAFCLDNTYSMMNSKLVFFYVLIEDKKNIEVNDDEAEVTVMDFDGKENKEDEILEWEGTDEDGKHYYLEVANIADSLTRTLRHVVKARHLLDIFAATKSRDSYLAIEDTFIVDAWSGVQISLMFVVGMLQVYMIKKLFNRPCQLFKRMY